MRGNSSHRRRPGERVETANNRLLHLRAQSARSSRKRTIIRTGRRNFSVARHYLGIDLKVTYCPNSRDSRSRGGLGRCSPSNGADSAGSNMALVKSSKIATGARKAVPISSPPKPMPLTNLHAPGQKVGTGTPETVFERIADATEEFASGLTQASAAAEPLRKSMEQIASGAEEAAGASQEQLAAIKRIFDGLRTGRGETDALRRRTDNVQITLGDVAERITASARAIERNAQRQ